MPARPAIRPVAVERRSAGELRSAELPEDALQVAVVGRAQALTGELRFQPTSGKPERLRGLKQVWLVLGSDAAGAHGATTVQVRVLGMRMQGRAAVVRLEGVTDRTAADGLLHAEVFARPADLPALGAHEFAVRDALGATLHDATLPGSPAVGRVLAVTNISDRDYFEIEREGGSAMVPLVKDWLVELDLPAGRVVMRLPEGLMAAASGADRSDGKDGAQ